VQALEKKDIQIKVQRENDAFVTSLADFINQEIEKLDRELEAKVQKIVEAKMEVLAKTPNEQLEGRYRSGGQPSV